MSNKDWLLKPESIKLAKACINIVQAELDIKLPLSHPEFMAMLNDYADMLDNSQLTDTVNELNKLAGITPAKTSAKVVNHPSSKPSGESDETIEYSGKNYPRWNDGKEFAGLYRGKPRYN